MRVKMRSLGTRTAFALLGVVIVVALAAGSHHNGQPTSTERVAHLESIIKCPSCADLTVAQSNSSEAVGLRTQITHFVAAGESDAEIEAYVVRLYPGVLLTPHGVSGTLAIGIPLTAFAIAGVVIAATLVRRGRGSGRESVTPDGDDLAIVSAALADRREHG